MAAQTEVHVVVKTHDISVIKSDDGEPTAVYIQAGVYTEPTETHPEGRWLSNFSATQSITPEMLED